MTPRERRQAIATHLHEAAALASSGRREEARARVEAALALDAGNAAAQSLRSEILERDSLPPATTGDASPPAPIAIAERPLVSEEGLARFERRARERRIERRLEAARAAIHCRSFAEAHAALGEAQELDAGRPDIATVALALEAAERAGAARPTSGGPLAAAAATFAAIVLGASLIGNTGFLQSYPIADIATLAPARDTPLASHEVVLDTAVAVPIGDQSFRFLPAPIAGAAPPPRSADPQIETPVALFVEGPPVAVSIRTLPVEPPPAAPPPAAPPPVAPPLAAAPPAPDVVAVVAADTQADEAQQVRVVLQRYQAAYDRLDARLAQVVWPGVNEAALARAFDGLESQTLIFEGCDVQLRGSTAAARCIGSTRYVPKVGSREPRIEPLVWNFTLRKGASDWEIETARADR